LTLPAPFPLPTFLRAPVTFFLCAMVIFSGSLPRPSYLINQQHGLLLVSLVPILAIDCDPNPSSVFWFQVFPRFPVKIAKIAGKKIPDPQPPFFLFDLVVLEIRPAISSLNIHNHPPPHPTKTPPPPPINAFPSGAFLFSSCRIASISPISFSLGQGFCTASGAQSSFFRIDFPLRLSPLSHSFLRNFF